jgi:hypothetical protein
METKKNVETYSNLINSIKYENENGGAYAYLQFLAYSREAMVLLRPIKRLERQIESIEAINWLFNEYLAVNFTFRHKIIFDEKKNEAMKIFNFINFVLGDLELKEKSKHRVVHAQAA